MAKLNISQAATATGKSRKTIERAVKSGTLSATKNVVGTYDIDVSELLRVYGELSNNGKVLSYDMDTTKHATMSHDVLGQIEDLKDKLRQAEARAKKAESQAEWALRQFEQEQAERRELSHRLLPAPTPEGGIIGKVKRFFIGNNYKN